MQAHGLNSSADESTMLPAGCLFSAAFGLPAISTGKERDTESGNDYFGARYYASTMGRFLSPDWSAKEEPVPYAKLDNPQTLNLYNYMRNNPLAGVDADGHCAEDACVGETVVGLGILAYGAVAGLQAYDSTPAGQRSIETFTSAASSAISNAVSNVKSFFSSQSSSSTPTTTTTTTDKPSAAPLPDDANVVRGGSGAPGGGNSPEGIEAGTGTHPSGVTGFSAESAPGKSVGELSKGIPNGQVGCCTVGQVRAAGGDVIPTSGKSPDHVTVTGLTPSTASKLLTPTIRNPSKDQQQ
jgi:RHS repeat-associated protein